MTPNTPSSDKTSSRWFYTDAQNQAVGPVSLDDLNKFVAAGVITFDTFVISEGETEWRPFRSVATATSLPPPPIPSRPSLLKTRRWPAVLSVLLLYPLGLIVLWWNTGYPARIKTLITAVSGLLFVLSVVSANTGLMVAAFAFNASVFLWASERLNRGAKIALIAILGVITLPALFVKPEPRPDTSETEATTGSHTKASKAGERQTAKIREDFRLGDFTYRIQGPVTTGLIGHGYAGAEASPKAIFIVVRYLVTNESKKTKTVLADDFFLLDSEGREFSPSTKALTALLMSEPNQDFIVRELQPGITRQAMTAFEVPYSSFYKGLTLVVPEKGLFGYKQCEVSLASERR